MAEKIDPRSPRMTWRSLAAAVKATEREFGSDAGWFYYYLYETETERGKWRRSLVRPRGAVAAKLGRFGRGVFRIDRAQWHRDKDFTDKPLLAFKRSPGYLYHLTTPAAYFGIRRDGLQPAGFVGIGTTYETGYGEHSRGGVFLSDAPGVTYWSAMASTKRGEKVLLRTKKRACPVDKPGTEQSTAWLRKKATAYKCASAILPSELEVWDPRGKRWRSVADVRFITLAETVLDEHASARAANPDVPQIVAELLGF